MSFHNKITRGAAVTALLSALLCSATVKQPVITLTNTLGAARPASEMAEIDADDIPYADFALVTQGGDTLPWQRTYDGKIIFPRPVMQGKAVRITVAEGKAGSIAPSVFGRLYPERQMDFSLENDRVAYRIYGPETMRKKERLYGYDIFLKRGAALVLDKFYDRQCDKEMWNTVGKLRAMGQRELADDVYQYGFCYHVDHGEGMDIYKVGATLGAGTNALLRGEDIIYPWCFRQAEVLDNGPLRLTVRLTFRPFSIGSDTDDTLYETRILTLDAGSRMVRASISYSADLPDAVTPICGIAVHKENPGAYAMDSKQGIIVYEDLGDPDIYRKKDRNRLDPQKGRTFIGCIMPGSTGCRFLPFARETSGAVGHVIAAAPAASHAVTYYFGYAWDRSDNAAIHSKEEWMTYLRQYAAQVSHPLKVRISK
mgnify:CR=1 FL=1